MIKVKNILCLFFIITGHVDAASDINFNGTLYEEYCSVNNDKPIDIYFGTVDISKIDGVQYTQIIPFSIRCDEGYTGSMSLTVETANIAEGNIFAIQTSLTGLGIKMMLDGVSIEPNLPVQFDSTKNPTLSAVPVKTNTSLAEGVFTATATLTLEID